MLKKVVVNILLVLIGPALLLGVGEGIIRTFYADKVRTYFDEQTELVLGHPVPRKQPGEYRIFIFGGSAAYGFPVADRYSIAAWLRKEFPYLLPGKNVKVMNCAWPGKASYHVLEGARTVLKYQPDLFIIYSGNNDTVADNRLYKDSLPYDLNLKLTFRSAFYRYLVKRAERLRKWFVYGHSGFAEKQYREEVIARKVYRNAEVDDAEYERVLKRYRKNMGEVIRLARQHGVDVLFVNLPSNLRNIPPSASAHSKDLTEAALAEWNRLFEDGKKAQTATDYAGAVELYRRAAAIDSKYAELQFRLGECLMRLNDYDAAKKAFVVARDFDGMPWRAKSSLNELIRRLCDENGVMFVDIVGALEKVSAHGIIDSEMLYDNVHPSIKAEQLIADEISRALMRNNKIAPESEWQWDALERSREDQDSETWKVDGSLNAYRYVLKGLYLWERKYYDEAIADLRKGLEQMPDFYESYAFLADAYYRRGETDQAAAAYRTLNEKDPALLKDLIRRYPDIEESYRANG